jgi:DinB superfamily
VRMAREEEPLVGPKRALSLLREVPDKIELMLRWCHEKDAGKTLPTGDSIRSVVTRLGTLERHHYLESVRRIVEGDPKSGLPGLELEPGNGDTDLADCELLELVTRFRHLRAQSTEFLEGLSDEAWDREGLDPVHGPIAVSRIVTHWVGHDAAALGTLSALCSAFHPS